MTNEDKPCEVVVVIYIIYSINLIKVSVFFIERLDFLLLIFKKIETIK